jgi:hypothetical protein
VSEQVCVARESASGPPGGRPAHLPGATARPGRASTPSLTSENWASDLAPQEGRHHRGRSGVPCAAKQWRGFSPSQDGREDCVQGAAGVAGGHRRARGAAAATVGAIAAQLGGRAPTEAAAIDLRHGRPPRGRRPARWPREESVFVRPSGGDLPSYNCT